MPAHDRQGQSLEAYLTRLLLAIVKKQGGELRVACFDIDNLDEKATLIRDYDRVTNELVLRAGTQFAEMLVVNPESRSWTIPLQERTQQNPALNPEPAKSRLMTDEELAEYEQRLKSESANRTRVRRQGPVQRTPEVS